MSAHGKATSRQKKKRTIIVSVCFVVICLCVELLGRVPGTSFGGWVDVFSWVGLPQPYVIGDDELQVHFIDVGNADCILVRQGKHNMLIDTGESTQKQFVLEYLERHEIDEFDLVISTHPHLDHMGMMDSIIRNYPIGCFVMTRMPDGLEPTNTAYTSMLQALEDYDVSVEEAAPGQVYTLGGAELQIVAPHPLEDPIEDANQITVVTRLTFGEHAFLFAGDAEVDLEERMVASEYDLSADVLKVAHHGSKTSTSPAFLRAVSPKYAVITCGRNDYGHPSVEVIRRLLAIDAQIYRSDVCGDIVFVSDGNSLAVKTEKGEKEARLLEIVHWCNENWVKEPLPKQRFFFARNII